MIRRTFQLLPGMGPWREKDLWARGVARWEDFPASGEGVVLSSKLDAPVRQALSDAQVALEQRDLRKLSALLPAREHWRLYPTFRDEAVFLDIETESREDPTPTVVSLFSPAGPQLFILGRNLDALPEALRPWKLWVTFNGSCFDVPILERYFGAALPAPHLHFDLRFFFRRLGMGCGLKQLEERMGIGRPPHLKGANGWDAVLLWRAYQRTGDVEALRFLAEYNLYDAFQLKSLAELGYNHAVERLALDEPHVDVFDRGDILYDVSRLLLELGPTSQDLQVLERVRRLAELG